MRNAPPLEVILYSRTGCHLCSEAQETLTRLARRFPHRLRTIDIEADPELLARYLFTIPVVVVGDQEYAAPLDELSLARALSSASR